MTDLSPAQHELCDLLAASKRAVALTGAGLSVPSGVPDFRSAGTGLWANVDPQQVANINAFYRDPARFWAFYRERLDRFDQVAPNAAHHALADLMNAGVLKTIVTQNIDGLQQQAGASDVLEVHGSTRTMTCTACRAQFPRAERDRLSGPDGVVRCEHCSELVKPDTILFGEMLPDSFTHASVACARADLLICVGTGLTVYPVAGLPEATLRAGGKLVIVTQSDTPYDRYATVRLGGDVADELAPVAAEAIRRRAAAAV